MNFFNKKLKNDSNPVKLLDRDKDDKKSSVPISLSNKDTFINKNSLLQKEIYNSNKVSSNNSNVSLSQKIAIIEQEKNMLKLTLSHIIAENKDLKQKIEDMEQTVMHNKTQLKEYVDNIANKDSLFTKLNNTIEILKKRLSNYEIIKKVPKYIIKKELSFTIFSAYAKLSVDKLMNTQMHITTPNLLNHNSSLNTSNISNNVDNFLTKVYQINYNNNINNNNSNYNNDSNLDQNNENKILKNILSHPNILINNETLTTNKLFDKSTKITNESNLGKFNNIDENIKNNLKKYAYHKSKYLSSDFNNYSKFNQSTIKPSNINISNDISNISNLSVGKGNISNVLITNKEDKPTKIITSLKKTNIQIIKQSILDKRKKLKEENDIKNNLTNEFKINYINPISMQTPKQTDKEKTKVSLINQNDDDNKKKEGINLNNFNFNLNLNSFSNASLNNSNINNNLKIEEINSINDKQNYILDEIKQIKNDLMFIMECSKISKSKLDKKIKISNSVDMNSNLNDDGLKQSEIKMKYLNISHLNLSKKYGNKKMKKLQHFLNTYNSENNILLLLDNFNNIWEIIKRKDLNIKDLKSGIEINSIVNMNDVNKKQTTKFSTYSQYNSMNVSRNNSRNFNTSLNNSINDNSRINDSWLRL